jgi:DNA repair protein RadC
VKHSSVGSMSDEQLIAHLLGRGANEEEVEEICGRLTNALDEVEVLTNQITWQQHQKEKSKLR